MEKISVCIATYNGEKYIYSQIESILKQLKIDDEVIISDDHSSDNTISEVNRFEDSRIKIFYNSGDKGYTSNFENALKYVSGDVVFLCDQDDIWVENKVSICLDYLENVDFVVSDCMVVNENMEVLFDSFFKIRKPKVTAIGNLIKFGFLGCCLTFRSDVLKKALPFPKNRKLCTHDNWLFLVGSFFFSHKIITDKLIFYRRHNYNLSTGISSSKTSFWFKSKYRLYLIYNLLIRLR